MELYIGRLLHIQCVSIYIPEFVNLTNLMNYLFRFYYVYLKMLYTAVIMLIRKSTNLVLVTLKFYNLHFCFYDKIRNDILYIIIINLVIMLDIFN